MSDDIVERLRAHLASDHKRGCDGRCYSCNCGYDNSTEDMLAKAADEIERLTAENARLGAEAKSYRDAIEWMRARDDRNGSLPEAYREKIDEALGGLMP